MAFETMTTASAGTGYTPSEDAKRTGNIQYLYDKRIERLGTSGSRISVSNSTASQLMYSRSILENTLGAGNVLVMNADLYHSYDGNVTTTFRAIYGSTVTASKAIGATAGNAGIPYRVEYVLVGDGSASAQRSVLYISHAYQDGGTGVIYAITGSSAENSGAPLDMKLTITMDVASASRVFSCMAARLSYFYSD